MLSSSSSEGSHKKPGKNENEKQNTISKKLALKKLWFFSNIFFICSDYPIHTLKVFYLHAIFQKYISFISLCRTKFEYPGAKESITYNEIPGCCTSS